MRHSVIAALWFASAAGGATAVMAQEEVEGLSVPVNIVASPSDRVHMEAYPLGYDTRGEDEARHVCVSCATLDRRDNSMTESPLCTLSSRRASDECPVGVDRGGHSKGWYL